MRKEGLEIINSCPECGSKRIEKDESRGELVCQDCGLVIEDSLIDHGPDWRAYDREQKEKRAHTGPPMTYTIHDKGLSTEIGWRNRDSFGKSIPTRNRAQLYRLRQWQRRIRVNSCLGKNIALAMLAIDRTSSVMGLPRPVRETAGMIYRKATFQGCTRGRTIEGMAATVVYAACRQCNVPRTLDEIAVSSGTRRKEIGRIYRFLTQKLKLRILPTSPQDYISRFCGILGIGREVRTKAIEIIEQATEKEITSGRGPQGVAAASIYIAGVVCGEKRTQAEIAKVVGVTEVTIRNRYKEIAEKLNIEIDV